MLADHLTEVEYCFISLYFAIFMSQSFQLEGIIEGLRESLASLLLHRNGVGYRKQW